jgi:Cof subfamily protein (haloacid dehalogenase superfamily)
MNTLYISDLDGTLLDKNAEISEFTLKALNALIKEGMKFTVATARSAATVNNILKDVTLPLPIILMNGVLVYDFALRRYLNIEYLTKDSLLFIQGILKELHLTGFMYEIIDHKQMTYYEELSNSAQKAFYEERVRKYHKEFKQVSDFSLVDPEHIIYFSILDTREHLDGACEKLKNRSDIAYAYYKDVYSKEDMWYLEIFSRKATKYNAVRYLREHYHFDQVVGFGDNLNDLPLFRACEVTCAVSNAREELKLAADHIIDSNINDGVVKWLISNYPEQKPCHIP